MPRTDSTGCTGTETACTATGVTAGLCVSGTCAPCNSPADNANCTTAYGGGTTSYVCNPSGVCVVGNCNVDTDCSTGNICGVTTANMCGPCTSDTQCQEDPTYGPGDICNTATGQLTSGQCVSAACTTADTACTANASDFRCASTSGVGNSCTPGNCCDNNDCTNSAVGSICGSVTANTCGPCTADSQCSGGTPICDIGTGKCVATTGQCSGTPGATGGKPGVCAANSNDMCCQAQPCIPDPQTSTNGVFACCPGSAGNTYCQSAQALGNTSAACTSSFTCTTCEAVGSTVANPPVYFVDPLNGNDGSTGSGIGADSGATETCALKTVTRALKLISVVGTALPTTIVIVGGTGANVSAGETFPLTIPTNVTVTTQTGPVTVTVSSANPGFVLHAPTESISSGANAPLTITGTPAGGAAVGLYGIEVNGTATSASTSISNLTITGMTQDGIHVAAGSIAIGAGVVSENNAVNGLYVTGAGSATINVPSGSTQTAFNGNKQHGIYVDTTATVNVTGASAGSGTVVTNGNTLAGIWIQQTPSLTNLPNVINGLVSSGNVGGNGMRIVAGSNVKVTNSVFLGNAGSGVFISPNATAGNANDDNVSLIDLGTAGANGGNVFQGPLNGVHNTNAGICLAIPNVTGAVVPQVLNAVGNTFSAANCATSAATLTLNTRGCGNNANQCATGVCDLGLAPPNPAAGTENKFTVTQCTCTGQCQ